MGTTQIYERGPFLSIVLATFHAGYGRSGYINLEDATCRVCDLDALCITMDSSEGEYGRGAICKTCAERAFAANCPPSEEK